MEQPQAAMAECAGNWANWMLFGWVGCPCRLSFARGIACSLSTDGLGNGDLISFRAHHDRSSSARLLEKLKFEVSYSRIDPKMDQVEDNRSWAVVEARSIPSPQKAATHTGKTQWNFEIKKATP